VNLIGDGDLALPQVIQGEAGAAAAERGARV